MVAISLVVITYARADMLRACLKSCIRQTTDLDGGVEIVVVDNNPAGTARPIVDEIASRAPVPVRYVHEPTPGIPNARNAGIAATEGPILGFVDDDQTLAEDWLALMTRRFGSDPVDCLFSNVEPVFSEPGLQPPPAIAGAYRRRLGDRGSGGALLRRATCFVDTTPFDPRTMHTGGEDTEFFARLDQLGRTFGWCMEAIAYEHVPSGRLKLSVVMQRQFAGGQHFAESRVRHSAYPIATAAKILAKAVMQSGGLAVAALVSPLLGRDRRCYVLIRLSGALGKLLWPLRLELRRRSTVTAP
ncbi:glycosyltransferase family 2 protein [Amorphus sp. 3PC139-8]|uniref:glycosyltransferase family 2 protein n=1 Tax=Amorphus sp. 3PC139-8 TaxID=2735676 RepID=UPI00345CF706